MTLLLFVRETRAASEFVCEGFYLAVAACHSINVVSKAKVTEWPSPDRLGCVTVLECSFYIVFQVDAKNHSPLRERAYIFSC